jgi:hypothetical protein
MEDLESADTKAFIEAQNALSLSVLAWTAAKGPLENRLTALWNYPRTGLPVREAGRLFFARNTGLEAGALYVRDSLDGRRSFLDAPPRRRVAFAQRSVSRRPAWPTAWPRGRGLAGGAGARDRHREGPRHKVHGSASRGSWTMIAASSIPASSSPEGKVLEAA